ncbi:secretion protein snm4 [Streptomyces albofaciens JCM 4342]|uniref:EsaB/YukD family protein n=1 Tax=Streptomyces albofaciens TaxID=66866 RepID=UPI00123AAAB9|nr:EsaB/YukD family protein [Streptomyces albofaciens]KAA6221110.1 secretion protein snm4 [Streptomyces albofaciens JCM 4342]
MHNEAGARVALRRVVLAGERRRVDLVLPAHEPVGTLLPEVLRAAGDPAAYGPSRCRLVTDGGAVLAQGETLASANVTDGSVLRLLREREQESPEAPMPTAPAPGVVGAVPGEGLDLPARRWDERSRAWTAVAAGTLLSAVAGLLAARAYGPEQAGPWLGGAALIVAGAGAVAGPLLGRRLPGTALLLMGGVLGVLASWDVTSGGAPRLAAVGLTVAAVLALLGICTGLGRGGLVGAAAVAAAVGVWEAGAALAGPARAAVLIGLVSVLALGCLPRLALTSAGLTRLDDRRSGGTPVSSHRVAAALGATHRGLTPAAVAMAGSAGAAGVLAAGGVSGTGGGWAVAGAVLLCVVLFSRARAYPLVLEVVALLTAGTAVCVRLALLWADGGSPAGALIALCLLAALPVAALAVRLPEHVRALLRRLTDVAEVVSAVALIPAGLGALGVFDRLL